MRIINLPFNRRLSLDTNLLVLMFLMFACFTYVHEYTHATINSYYGCEKSEFGVSFKKLAFYTKCADVGFECSDACIVSHSNMEIVGYNVMPALIVIIAFVGADYKRRNLR